MDLNDYRAEFPITENYAFLSHAASSPLNRRAAAAVSEYLERAQALPGERVRPTLLDNINQLRSRAAALINAASPDEIALIPNTAAGINTAALSLPLRAGDNVLVLDGDYPANIYPWMNLAHKGVLTKVVPQRAGGLDLDVLAQRIDRRTRVIALSAVMFATGFRNDLEAVGKLCSERGIYFVVDGIQALGALPIDVQACKIDFLVAGSQKWLLSAHGSGFLYCRSAILDQLEPGAYVGTASVVDPENYLDYNFTLQPSAQRFELGSINFLGALALNASLGLLAEVGSERIHEKVLQLSDALINDLSERGYTMAADTALAHRSGIVVAEMSQDQAQAGYQRLREANIVATVRGRGLRLAPHFYNTVEEVLRVGEVLGDR